MEYYNTQNMSEIDAASYFLYNLATEPVVQTGVSGTTTTYIVYTSPQINTYIDLATEMSIGISELQNGNSQNVRSKELDIFEEVVTSVNYRQRLNLLWEDSTKHQDFEYWKYESWFGHFMDEIPIHSGILRLLSQFLKCFLLSFKILFSTFFVCWKNPFHFL